MIKRLVTALAAVVLSTGVAVIATEGTAHADSKALVATNAVDYCHGGNCDLGWVRAGASIWQWLDNSGNVIGTRASCSMTIFGGVSRVQIERTAEGQVNGVALYVDSTPHNSNGASGITNIQPGGARAWLNTGHIGSLATPSDWDIKTACQGSIRWSDGGLASGLAWNSNPSNDYFCANGLQEGPPCHVRTDGPI
jgi:hypothetical protein